MASDDACRRVCCTTTPLVLKRSAKNKSGFVGVQTRDKGYQVHVTPRGARQSNLVHTSTATALGDGAARCSETSE